MKLLSILIIAASALATTSRSFAQEEYPASPVTDTQPLQADRPSTSALDDDTEPTATEPPVTPEGRDVEAAQGTAELGSEQGTGAEEEAPAELSAEELASLGLVGEGPPVDTSIKLSGFMDFTFSGLIAPKDSFFRGVYNRHPSFWMGNINLYVSKSITESIRTFFEVRFSYLPNGTPDPNGMSGELITTAIPDYNDAARSQRWSGIIMQRAYLEWVIHSRAILRVGQYLTPYGIWNVDHGSPTIVTVLRPYTIGAQLFPERQTGLELSGQLYATAHHAFNYALTVSNGYGPVSEYRDLDGNKAVGGRFSWTYDKLGHLRVGGSGLWGSDTSARENFLLKPDGTLAYREKIDLSSDVLSLAGDVRWEWANLLLQGEVISQQRRFTNDGRVGAPNLAVGNQYLAPKDAHSWGGYGLTGYRFRWFGVMPYVMYTYNTIYDQSILTFGRSHAASAGLNIRPIDAVVLKVEYLAVQLVGKNRPTADRLQFVQAQLAWAF